MRGRREAGSPVPCRKEGGFSISADTEALERLASSFQTEDYSRNTVA